MCEDGPATPQGLAEFQLEVCPETFVDYGQSREKSIVRRRSFKFGSAVPQGVVEFQLKVCPETFVEYDQSRENRFVRRRSLNMAKAVRIGLSGDVR